MLICLDPGHSGPVEPGCCYEAGGLTEAAAVLPIAKAAKTFLESAGHDVILTRYGPINTDDLAFRTTLANIHAADLFVSIHANASKLPEAHGTETYCHESSDNGRLLARHIQQSMITSLGTWDRGVKTADFFVLRETNMPAALAEVAFLSNELDRAAALSTDRQRSAAGTAIGNGILDYIAAIQQTTLL